MNRLRARLTGRNRALALWIVACALMLRIVVPAGWMPVIGQDGMTRITLCTGQGMVEAFVDRAGTIHHKAPGQSEPKTDQPCSFAGLAFAFTAPAAPAIQPPLQIAAADPASLPGRVSIGHGLAAPPPPATGPPIIL